MNETLSDRVHRRLPGEPDRAEEVVRAVLHELGEHLPAGEAALLAAELSPPLRRYLRHPGPPSTWDDQVAAAGDLPEQVARACRTDHASARRYTEAVLGAVADTASPAVLYRVQVALPDEVRALFPDPLPAVGTEPTTGPVTGSATRP